MHKIFLLFAAWLIIFFTPQGIYAQAPTGDGVINGSLVNGTAGASTPNALTVSLTIYRNKVVEDIKYATSSDQGQFSFSQLPTDASYSFVAGTVYQKVTYSSDLISFSSGQLSASLQLKVYESTTAAVPISIMMSHSVLNYASGLFMIKEYNFFVNSGDRTYLGVNVDPASGRMETLKLSLPSGASGFLPDPALANYLTISGSQVSYSAPLLPGSNQIIYSYVVPGTADKYRLDWKINYNIMRYDLLVLNQDVRVSGPKLTQEESLDLGGTQYQDYSSQNLKAGDILTAEFSGLLGNKTNYWVYLWLLLIPAAVLAVFYIWRKKKNLPASQPVKTDEAEEPEISVTPGDRQLLLLEIARLDDKFEAGLIEEKEYRERRSALKLKISKMNPQ
jgi:hypothetical protein